jgi:hypothetical protein
VNGYNPLRWNCEKSGCFNKYQRPKIEVFCDNFPGRINFSDIDGIVEVKGNALLLEWKGEAMPIPTGQRIMYERLSREGMISVLCVAGDAETMEVNSVATFYKGKWSGWKESNLEEINKIMKDWTEYALSNPKL